RLYISYINLDMIRQMYLHSKKNVRYNNNKYSMRPDLKKGPWKKGQSLNVYSTEQNRLYPLRLLIHRVFPILLKVKKGSDVVFFAVHPGGKIITMYYEGDYKN